MSDSIDQPARSMPHAPTVHAPPAGPRVRVSPSSPGLVWARGPSLLGGGGGPRPLAHTSPGEDGDIRARGPGSPPLRPPISPATHGLRVSGPFKPEACSEGGCRIATQP